MNADKTFYETTAAKVVPWIFLSLISIIALFVPIVSSIFAIKIAVYLVLLFSILCLIKSAVTKRAVVTLQDDGIILRGVRPGIWKLFQRWITERIDDTSVSLIRIGYLREKQLGQLFSLPPGESSKGAMFQMFLWVKYDNHGCKRELYYPHLKNVSRFMELIQSLESRYGSKVEKHL
ncbi:MAG TPA: hypothetical protein VH595_21645 [Verrucomicrobiae bacterium]|jgi:hypothetical protein|nr:hypothetical protein [Verrucomicrobiae bacterium]